MKPAQVVADVVDAGGTVWVESGRLKARRVPAHLIPFIRKHKASLLALLTSAEIMYDTTPAATVQHSAAMAPQSEFTDPGVMAETLLLTMRAIGLRVRLTAQGELRIGPSDMLWPYDRELIEELKPQLAACRTFSLSEIIV